MSNEQQPDPTRVAAPQGEVAGKRLGVLLACFEGVGSASKARGPLSKQMSQGADEVLDEVVLRVNGKGKVQVYDPRRVLAGTLTRR